jgi:hypothetical protein
MDWCDDFVAASNTHEVEALIAMFAPSCRYTDVPYRTTWEGHDGIRKLFEVDMEFHADKRMVRRDGFHDDQHYALEWMISGTVCGQQVTYPGCSIGSLDGEGRIVENRDYWNPKDIPNLGEWKHQPPGAPEVGSNLR